MPAQGVKVSPRGIVALTCECAERVYGPSLVEIRVSGFSSKTFYPIVITFGDSTAKLTKTFNSLQELAIAAKGSLPR